MAQPGVQGGGQTGRRSALGTQPGAGAAQPTGTRRMAPQPSDFRPVQTHLGLLGWGSKSRCPRGTLTPLQKALTSHCSNGKCLPSPTLPRGPDETTPRAGRWWAGPWARWVSTEDMHRGLCLGQPALQPRVGEVPHRCKCCRLPRGLMGLSAGCRWQGGRPAGSGPWGTRALCHWPGRWLPGPLSSRLPLPRPGGSWHDTEEARCSLGRHPR